MNNSQAPGDDLEIEALDGGLDLGEARSETIRTTAEIESANQNLIETNVELVKKLSGYAVEAGVVRAEQVENFTLTKKEDSIGALQRKIAEISDRLKATSGQESADENEELMNQKMKLIVELAYSFTALVKKEIPKFSQKLAEEIANAKQNHNLDSIKDNLLKVKKLAPQWEPFMKNSKESLVFLRREHSDVISNEFLGELNISLYNSLLLTPAVRPWDQLSQKYF